MNYIQEITEHPVRVVFTDDPVLAAQDALSDGMMGWHSEPFLIEGEFGVLFIGDFTEFVGHPGDPEPDIFEVELRILYATPNTPLPFRPDRWGTVEVKV